MSREYSNSTSDTGGSDTSGKEVHVMYKNTVVCFLDEAKFMNSLTYCDLFMHNPFEVFVECTAEIFIQDQAKCWIGVFVMEWLREYRMNVIDDGPKQSWPESYWELVKYDEKKVKREGNQFPKEVPKLKEAKEVWANNSAEIIYNLFNCPNTLSWGHEEEGECLQELEWVLAYFCWCINIFHHDLI